MELIQKLKEDLKSALKEKDSFKIDIIRLLLASVQNEQIAKGKDNELSDSDIEGILRKEVKKRRESIDIYEGANRPELAQQEKQELELIKTYLPEEMSDEDLDKIIQEEIGSGEEHFGKLMGAVMQKTNGRAESSRVKEAIEKALK